MHASVILSHDRGNTPVVRVIIQIRLVPIVNAGGYRSHNCRSCHRRPLMFRLAYRPTNMSFIGTTAWEQKSLYTSGPISCQPHLSEWQYRTCIRTHMIGTLLCSHLRITGFEKTWGFISFRGYRPRLPQNTPWTHGSIYSPTASYSPPPHAARNLISSTGSFVFRGILGHVGDAVGSSTCPDIFLRPGTPTVRSSRYKFVGRAVVVNIFH